MRKVLVGIITIALAAARALGQATVHFTIDAKSDVKPISRLIYGINQDIDADWTNVTFRRFGGNRTTAYNWVTNFSNAGSDFKYQNDDGYFVGGNTPGGALIPVFRNAYDHNAGVLVTIPMAGFVAGDAAGPVDIHDPNRFLTRFKRSEPAKGSAFTLRPEPAFPVVYQDEFVNWVKTNYGYGQTDPNRPICFALDNEVDISARTHPEVHPAKLTYAELMERTIAYSTAIKNVEPDALVYGPVNYGWGGILNLQKAPDARGRDFETFYLHALADARRVAGKRLLDVLDIHWYPEIVVKGVRITEPSAAAAVVAARLQAPRSLWDPDYKESSWVTRDSLHGPIKLIPMLEKKIADNFPGTKLSISEYNYGGGGDISGAIAEADVLGIFGKLGIYSANEWPVGKDESFTKGAMAMYRNIDGKNRSFGDTSVSAKTDDAANTSIYSAIDSSGAPRLTVIAINKSAGQITAEFHLEHCGKFYRGEIFQLTRASSKPASAGELKLIDSDVFSYQMPAMSVSCIHMDANPR